MQAGDLVRTKRHNELGIVIKYAGPDDHEPDVSWWIVATISGTTWYHEGLLEVICK